MRKIDCGAVVMATILTGALIVCRKSAIRSESATADLRRYLNGSLRIWSGRASAGRRRAAWAFYRV